MPPPPRTVLLDAPESQLGRRVAHQLAGLPQVRLAELPLALRTVRDDVARQAPPAHAAHLAEALRAAAVDTVVLLDMAGEESPMLSSEDALRRNVLGTMLLLGACATAGVRRVVLRGSTLVYGGQLAAPAFIDEDWPLAARQSGLLRHYTDIAAFAASFARRNPALHLLELRCAPLVGGGISSPMTRYLEQRRPPLLLGFNPRMQLLHPDDAASAFVRAILSEHSGALHIAAAAPLPLAQIIGLCGKRPATVAEPLISVSYWLGQRHALLRVWPFGRALLRYACVADTRRAAAVLGWQPSSDIHAMLCDMTSTGPPRSADPQLAAPWQSEEIGA